MNTQLDYIFFLYGLSFILLAMVVQGLVNRDGSKLPWKWMVRFGLLHGMTEWLNMLTLSSANAPLFAGISTILLASSYLCLLEFGRQSALARSARTPGAWIALPLLALALLGEMAGRPELNIGIRFALGLTGGLWTAWTLWRECDHQGTVSRAFAAAAVAMALYALVTGLVDPMAVFFPPSALNHHPFLAARGGSAQLLQGLLVVVIVLAFWRIKSESSNDRPSAGRWRFLPLFVGIAVTAGWAATEWQGLHWENEENNNLMRVAKAGAAALDGRTVATLSGESSDLATSDYQKLKDHLMRLRRVEPDVRFVYITRLVGDKIVILADSETTGFRNESPPGQIYGEAPQSLRTVFADGVVMVGTPYTDRWGTWVSAFVPLVDGHGNRIAMLGIDVSARRRNALIAQQRLLVILITTLLVALLLIGYVAQRHHDAAVCQSVMIGSIGAVCHHLAQPMTILSAFLQTARKEEKSASGQSKLDDCVALVFELSDIIKKLKVITRYRTEPYAGTVRILKIDKE